MADLAYTQDDSDWKPIDGWPNYEINPSRQAVRSLPRRVAARGAGFRVTIARELKPALAANGYLIVTLSENQAMKSFYMHRLVCVAAHGPAPKDKPIARHLNGNALDNRPENLAWGSQKDNLQDMVAHGRSTKGVKNPMAILDEEKVRTIRRLSKQGVTQTEIGRLVGVKQQAVSAVVKGKSWSWLTDRNEQ